MQLYFSGISSDAETLYMAKNAGAKLILVNYKDLQKIQQLIPNDFHVAIDCDAYKRKKLDLDSYLQYALNCPLNPDFVVAADVRGDAEQTLANWEKLKVYKGVPWLPVWGWECSKDRLKYYLDESAVVGIGNLVPLMRQGQHEKTDAANQMLDELINLCQTYPGRLHIFGVCWLKAIEALKGIARSGDTSKALSSARYGDIIFQHTKNKHLYQIPYKMIPQYAHLDNRFLRCVESIRTLNKYCNEIPQQES